MAITAALVKELRDSTGAGMMDAKKALTETNGDMEAAVDWLRTKGLAKAAKKSGRTAAEGLVGTHVSNGLGVMVEVNSETDFVSKNAEFQEMVSNFTKAALKVNNVDELVNSMIGDHTINEILTNKISTIGENMAIRRLSRLEGGSVASYVHNSAADGMGKISVIVALESTGDKTKLMEIGKQLAMHVAAAKPQSLNKDGVDPSIVQREKDIFTEQSRASGKPDNIIEKMIEGRIRKFLEEIVLLDQAFVIDGKTKI